ncbi:MAG: hypothetical protein WCK26_02020 [Candidatus Saccharibacteria bacterium]
MPRKNKTIKHQSYQSNRLFCDKRRYKNETDAQNAAEFQMLEKMTLELSVYKCNLCRYWHLTRKTSI